MAKLPPDLHAWLKYTAVLWDHPWHMNMNDVIVHALEYYRSRPEDTLDDQGRRLCCGTTPAGGHRGTCTHSAMRGGLREYERLQAMWESGQPGTEGGTSNAPQDH